jgi:heme-degrading monooxygenase HmoA
MITVIVGFKKKVNTDISHTLRSLISYARTFHGFSRVKYTEMVPDCSVSLLIYEWETLEDWKIWEISRVRKQIFERAQDLLVEKPRTKVYKDEPTGEWIYTPLK